MCGRLACYLSSEELCSCCSYVKETRTMKPTFSNTENHTYVPLYNLSPTSTVPVLLANQSLPKSQQQNFDNSLLILPMRWGLIPRWVDSSSSTTTYSHTHNARLESLTSSPMYSQEVKQCQRCVILCNGYYEWKTTGDKQPYYLYHEKRDELIEDLTDWMGEPILKLAGIFSYNQDKNIGIRYSCSIITREADSNLSWLHHRMPIPLNSSHDVEKWLFSNQLNCEESLGFIKTYGMEESKSTFHLKYHPVEKEHVNKSKNNDKKCIERVAIKRKNTLDNWLCKRPSKGV